MKRRILVVDDSPLVLGVICKYLDDKGYATLMATNGIEAIEQTFRELPDLILLDVMMPRMNGYQACRLLKSDPETRAIPIIMLTVKDQASDKYWGLQTGADAYLSKEFVQTTLTQTMEDLLQKRQKQYPAKSLIREHSRIDAIDIISKVNDLLDKKLFEATVLNEMSSLIERGIENYGESVTIVMEMMGKILDFSLAVIVTIDDHDVECAFKIHRPVSKSLLEDVQQYTRNYLKTCDIYLSPQNVMTVFDPDKVGGMATGEKPAIQYFSVPIKFANKLGGLIILVRDASDQMDQRTEEFLRVVAKQAYVIMANSWLYNKIKRLAITDSLTGIYNHGFLYEALCKEFARTERFQQPLSLLMLDLDYFKKINDTYGHQAGDDVLRKVATIIKGSIRVYDVFGRYGGEEFSIILPDANTQNSLALSERIRNAIERYNFGDKKVVIKCTISIGVSSYPNAEVKSEKDLIFKADKALYRAKAEGRNRVCVL